MKETWKDIKGYEHAYQISNLGRFKSKERTSKSYKDGRSQGHYLSEKIRKPSVKNGYFFLWLYDKNGLRKMEYIHRLVAKHFVLKKNGTYIDHIDRNRQNNTSINLRWTTQSINCHNTTKKTCGFYWSKQRKKYHSRITVENKVYHLGFFETEKEAREAYLYAYKNKVLALLR